MRDHRTPPLAPSLSPSPSSPSPPSAPVENEAGPLPNPLGDGIAVCVKFSHVVAINHVEHGMLSGLKQKMTMRSGLVGEQRGTAGGDVGITCEDVGLVERGEVAELLGIDVLRSKNFLVDRGAGARVVVLRGGDLGGAKTWGNAKRKRSKGKKERGEAGRDRLH